MSIEVVKHEMYGDRGCLHRFQQLPDECRNVRLGAAGGNLDTAPVPLGFDRHKDVSRPGAPDGSETLPDRLPVKPWPFKQITLNQLRSRSASRLFGMSQGHA